MVVLQLDAEFRRFSISHSAQATFEDFYAFLEKIHHLTKIRFLIGYTDAQGELLPINNDDNYHKALDKVRSRSRCLLRFSCLFFEQVYVRCYKYMSAAD